MIWQAYFVNQFNKANRLTPSYVLYVLPLSILRHSFWTPANTPQGHVYSLHPRRSMVPAHAPPPQIHPPLCLLCLLRRYMLHRSPHCRSLLPARRRQCQLLKLLVQWLLLS